MSMTFQQLAIDPVWISRLKEMKITEPTPVQEAAIPVLAAGRDALIRSGTGTGKTLAYLLPMLQRLDPSLAKLQGLVLAPTRELGAQIYQVIQELTEGTDIRSQMLIGGAAIGRQIERLKKQHPHLVVGTPGRILELLKLKKLSLHYVRLIVLDEADHMLELGAKQEIEDILRSTLRDRQLAFLSATMPSSVRQLAGQWMRDPEVLELDVKASNLSHYYVVTEERKRIDTLRRLIVNLNPAAAIVFTNEVDRIGEIVAKLQYGGIDIEALYSEAGKEERTKVMKDFREGKLKVLLATDVAARGLDIPEITHVFHFDLAIDGDHYLHRSGRAGRMGRQGTVISLCTRQEAFIIRKLSKATGIPIEQRVLYGGQLHDPKEVPARQPAASAQPSKSAKKAAAPGSVQSSTPAAADLVKPAASVSGQMAKSAVSDFTASADSVKARVPQAVALTPVNKPKPVDTPRKPRSKSKSDKNKGAPRWLKEKWKNEPET